MLKNLTLAQVIRLLTLLLTGVQLVIFTILYLLGALNQSYIVIGVGLIVTFFVASYFISKYLIEQYVLTRIRELYNLIRRPNQKISYPTKEKIPSIENIDEEVSKWAEEKEEEIKNLTQLEDYRRNFLGNISHELKTPIFSMQGYLHTLAEGGIHDEKINVKYLDRAIANLERLEHIVEDLDTINNLESEIEKLTLKPFDIKELTEEVFVDLEFLCKKRNISLALKNGASKSFTVLGDSKTIRQVLDNLLSNSIKYGRQDGSTTVGFIDVADHVMIEIQDDGIGIHKEHLNHIFDRFYRVDPGRGRKKGGSGLGLSIVKHIIEAHDETITVNSTIGAGSTFAFTLKKAPKSRS